MFKCSIAEAVEFAVGDLVTVRSEEEITGTLDAEGKLDGLLFAETMRQYCGESYRVAKIARNYFDEKIFKMFRPRRTLFILEGVICNGQNAAGSHRCDRSCFLLWHPSWLRRQ